MSTKLTTNLPLVLLLGTASHWLKSALVDRLASNGFALSEPQLMLLANLDCGTTKASDVARRMGVSRQAIARTTRDMASAGFLSIEPDPDRGNQNILVMTPLGEDLALAARAAAAEVERRLETRVGAEALSALRKALSQDWGDI